MGALLGCAGGQDNSIHVEHSDSAGVAIVSSIGTDVSLDRLFMPAFSLGGTEEGATSFYRLLPQNVAVAPNGNINVLDPGAFHVVVFDSTGRVLRSFGREGDGPGEFSAPTALAVRPDGRIAVFDFRKRGLEWFDSLGVSVNFEPVGVPFRGGPIIASSSGLLLPVRETDRERSISRFQLVHLGAADTTVITSQEQPLGRDILYTGCGLSITLPPLFTPSLTWAAQGDLAAVVNGVEYVIDIYHGAQASRRLRRNVAARSVTEAMAIAEVGEGEQISWSDGNCTVPPAVVVQERGFAALLSAIGAVAVSPTNEIWARRGAVRGEPALTDIFSADGVYLGTLPERSPWPVAFLPDGRLVAIEKDELDIERLVVYRMLDGGVTGK
jgi:hypothetical protein